MFLGYWKRSAVLLVLAWVAVGATSASAAEPPYEFDPVLSLTGNCNESIFDPIPDPSCPYPAPPGGPSGRFDEARAIAVDSFGDEYVSSYAESASTGRIDVFDDEGKFITEVAAPNAKSIAVDSKGNLDVYEDDGSIVRYPPSEYEPEANKIKYANPPVAVATREFFGALAIDAANDQLLVIEKGILERFSSAATNNEVLSTTTGLGDWTEAMAVDAQRRRIYISFCEPGKTTECAVKVLNADSPGTVLEEIKGSDVPAGQFAANFARMGLAVDEETGDFFIADIPSVKTVYQFNEDYENISEFTSSEFLANISFQIAVSNGKRSLSADACEYPTAPAPPPGDACNRHYLFIPVFKPAGRALAFKRPGQTPPVIEDVSTANIGETEAELRATIFPGGLDTEYHFEITTQEAFEAEGFEGAAIFGEGTVPAESLATEVSAFATGLSPGETYRFRAVAENELGPAEEEGQNEATFTTYEGSVSPPPCANQALRTGLSAQLPDCRAYELVTPPDTNGRAPKSVGFVGELFPTLEASPAGDAVWFKIEGGSIPGSSGVGSFEGDPYVATRGASGWSSKLAGATGEEATVSIPGSSSPDQGYAFWSARIEGPLVINGEETQYLRYPDGHSELIGRGSLGTDPKARGKFLTEDASHVIFETNNAPSKPAVQLEPDAPATGTPAVYDRTIDPITGKEETHVVSLLPGDVTPESEVGTYAGASKDGEGIAFLIGPPLSSNRTLYLRVNNETTYEAGENVEFAGVSESGGRIFYVEGDDLLAFDTSSEEVIEFSTTGDVTPVNVSNNGSRAYFVSPSVLGGANPEGDVAEAGEQNLYLSEEGSISFVATVTDRDVEGEAEGTTDGLGLWTDVVSTQLAKDPSRTNPDGSVLLFQSRADITGYPAGSAPQVYRYDSDADRLHCISCIPTGTPATGGASLQTITFDSLAPPPLSPSAYVPNVTPDGRRVFFESDDALVSTDTDGVKDVYEWEENGVGSCSRGGGCVYLISSGQSARDNFLYAHSRSGGDVFFATEDTLVGSDAAGTSIYDAKVGGGFPEPPPPPDCTADACRPQVNPAPVLPVPAVPAPPGADDQVSPARSKNCPKGKRKVKKNGKVRCVKKKQHKKHKGKGGKAKQRTGTDRGGAR